MNERQKYLFDLQGYLLVEDVLSPEDCDVAIEKIKARAKPMEKTPDGYAAIYHAQEPRRPSAEALAQMTDNQKCYFNLAYQAFGPPENPRNDQPQFG